MLIDAGSGAVHLTYCTNVHPGESWAETFAALGEHLPAVKDALCPGAPFGVGLRLSDRASRDLLEGDALERFSAWLEGTGLYVFTVNGFPHGAFHGARVKDNVFAPDWTDERRAEYTERLARILATLLPEGMHGGISTCPLSYKPWFSAGRSPEWTRMIGRTLDVVRTMSRLRRERGVEIHLDIEPEPDGLLETTDEFVGFVEDLLLPAAREREIREEEVLRHVGLCLDTCHAAIEFEEARPTFDRLDAAGLRIGKVQVSSAIQAEIPVGAPERAGVREALERFVEPTYLHQVIGQSADGAARRWPDLPAALQQIDDSAGDVWRVHFHVPLFVDRAGPLETTQRRTEAFLREAVRRGATDHFETETYTWEALPADLRTDLDGMIERELRWTAERLAEPGGSG